MSLINGEYIELLKAKVAELKAQLAASKKREEILREALDKISKYFVSFDGGRFGAFINAGAVNDAKEALKKADEVK